MKEIKHVPVLLEEVIKGLKLKEDGIYVDATMGGAGHSGEILKRIPKGHLYCFDQDEYAVRRGKSHLETIGKNFTIIKSNFINVKTELLKRGITKINGILYDLGVSSFQLDISERGFSFHKDAILDMRMDQNNPKSAHYIVNNYSEKELTRIFYKYGEEKFAPQISKNIINARAIKPIKTTFELVEIIKKSLPSKSLRKPQHPARKVFQALRIEVNNELTVFLESVRQVSSLIKSGGRCAVITFHSLEDRICKREFLSLSEVNLPKGLPLRDEITAQFKLVNKKVIVPTKDEQLLNPRSSSAKLRIIEKI